jgi:hypothetical protein
MAYHGISPVKSYEIYTLGEYFSLSSKRSRLTGSQTVVCGDFHMSGVNDAD